MTLSTKILMFIFGVLFLGLGGFLIYHQIETSKKLDDLQNTITSQKDLIDKINRAESSYATKDDIDAFAKAQNLNLDAIKSDLATLNAQVQAINSLTFVSSGEVVNGGGSTSVIPRTDPPTPTDNTSDPFGYLKNSQHLELSEQFKDIGVPIGSVNFNAWKDKPWDINIAERKYTVNTVIGTDANSKHYSYSQININTGGKDYLIPIDTNKYMEETPSKTFSWLNPRLFIGMDGGVNVSQAPLKGEFSPSLNVGIMSYGQYLNNPDLSILQLGLGYGVVEKSPQLIFSPIQVNIGKSIPLMNNLYVGPSLSISVKGNIGIGAGIRVGL